MIALVTFGLLACHDSNPSGNDASSTTPANDGPASNTASDSSTAGDVVVGGDTLPAITPDNFATVFASACCGSITACCQQSGLDSSTCQEAVVATVGQWVAKHTADPQIILDPDAAGRCIDQTRSAFAACSDRGLADQSKIACKRMIRGTVPLGGNCTNSGQCLPTADGAATCNAGVCVVAPPPAGVDSRHRTVGEACNGTCRPSNCSWSGAGTGVLCWTDDGLYCDNSLGVCVAAPAVGEACELYCGKDAHCTYNHICAANLTVGYCESNDDCSSQSCCDKPDTESSGQCALLKQDGTPCTAARQCTSGQCLNATCLPWSMANDRVCSGVIF